MHDAHSTKTNLNTINGCLYSIYIYILHSFIPGVTESFPALFSPHFPFSATVDSSLIFFFFFFSMDFPSAKKPTIHKTPKIILPLALTIIFLTVFPLYYTFNRTPNVEADLYPPNQRTSEEIRTDLSRNPPEPQPRRIRTAESLRRCDIFTGEWVPNPEAPYYTNDTCWGIQEHQNCMKFGRPDNGYLKWRWKPDGCELPIFDPFDFLDLVRGKALAFVGDSIARNHMQSLVCLLSSVCLPFFLKHIYPVNFAPLSA